MISYRIASFLKSRPVGRTAHLEYCLEFLSANPEGPGDLMLVALARIYHINDDWNAISTWRQIESCPTQGEPPPAIHVASLKARLEHVKKLIPPEILDTSKFAVYPNWSLAHERRYNGVSSIHG